MSIYDVRVARASRDYISISVEADGAEVAEAKAIETAKAHRSTAGWEHEDSDYFVSWSTPGTTLKADRADILRFWRHSDALATFIDTVCNGVNPPGVVLNGQGAIVLRDGARDTFLIVDVRDGKFVVLEVNDALMLADPEAEHIVRSSHESIEAAFTDAASRIYEDFSEAPPDPAP